MPYSNPLGHRDRPAAEHEAGVRRRPRIELGISLFALARCGVAPSQPLLGPIFRLGRRVRWWGSLARSWCISSAFAGIEKFVPAPLIADIAFAVFFGVAFWLAWLG